MTKPDDLQREGDLSRSRILFTFVRDTEEICFRGDSLVLHGSTLRNMGANKLNSIEFSHAIKCFEMLIHKSRAVDAKHG